MGGGRRGPALLTGRFCFLWGEEGSCFAHRYVLLSGGGGGVLLCSQVGSAFWGWRRGPALLTGRFCFLGVEEGSCFAHR